MAHNNKFKKKTQFLISVVVMFILLSFSPINAIAAEDPGDGGEKIGTWIGTFKGLGPLGNTVESGSISPAASLFTKVLSVTFGVITAIGFIWFLFNMVGAAISWISSGGDKAKLENSRKQITNSLIGLVLVIASLFLVRLVGTVLGIPNILNIGGYIKTLGL